MMKSLGRKASQTFSLRSNRDTNNAPPIPVVAHGSVDLPDRASSTIESEQWEPTTSGSLAPPEPDTSRVSTDTLRPAATSIETHLTPGLNSRLRAIERSVPLSEQDCWLKRYISGSFMFEAEGEAILREEAPASSVLSAIREIESMPTSRMLQGEDGTFPDGLKTGLALERCIYGENLTVSQRQFLTARPPVLKHRLNPSFTRIDGIATKDFNLPESSTGSNSVKTRREWLHFMFPTQQESERIHAEVTAKRA